MKRLLHALCALSMVCAIGCTGEAPEVNEHDGHDEEASMPTNRVDIPPAVRRNLGITFARVEARRVEQTLRVPGRFEYLPTAHREYRTMLPGRVELLVEQFDRVEAGDALFRIDAPEWRQTQQRLADNSAAIERLRARLDSFGPLHAAHKNHERQLQSVIDVRTQRVERLLELAEAGGGRAGELSAARDAVATAQAQLAETLEKEAELRADEAEVRAELEAARTNREFLFDSASTLVGLPVEKLTEESRTPGGRRPFWRGLATITVHAREAGVVESIGMTNGAWSDREHVVLTVVRPERLRFHAIGLQSDMGRLRDGLPARIVAPAPTRVPGAIDLADSMTGTLALGLSGDPDDRTVDLYVRPDELARWARAGVSAHLEIVTDGTASPTLAIPRAAVQRDGLTPVYFRRDPDDPNKAIRVEADLGLDDGRWIAVNSGLMRSDEVVLDGAFQLMLASSSGGMQQGGHFHADGTFHADDDH